MSDLFRNAPVVVGELNFFTTRFRSKSNGKLKRPKLPFEYLPRTFSPQLQKFNTIYTLS